MDETKYVAVAAVTDLPCGQMMRVEAHGDRILVVNLDGDLHAICDTCSHEDASLYLGALDNGTIRCPLHGSRFDLKTGAPMEEPAEESVAVYPVKIVDGQIWIGCCRRETAI